MLLLTRNKNPVHGRKLCSLFTANDQYTKMGKPALKTVSNNIKNSKLNIVQFVVNSFYLAKFTKRSLSYIFCTNGMQICLDLRIFANLL